MADENNSLSSRHSSDPQLFSRDICKSIKNNNNNKKKRLATPTSTPPIKRQIRSSSADEEDDEDTATSKLKKIEDVDVLHALLEFHSRNGVYPFWSSFAMRDFLSPWIRMGLGKAEELKLKIEHLQKKFKKQSTGAMEPGEEEEFKLWMKIWGKKEIGDN